MLNTRATKILIIDDEKELCSLLREYFSGEGYVVEVTYDGDSGITKAKSFEPDIIILDYRMPVTGGAQVIKAVRKSFSTPIICVSAVSSKKTVDECLQLGATKYIHKPIILEDLMDQVQNCLILREK
ncbi:MAG: response regulator [Nitrospinae bacterium]|nr:response regulator [Nitrospinota bacterium]